MFYFNLKILFVGVLCSMAYADAMKGRLDDDLMVEKTIYQSWEHSQNILEDTYSSQFNKCESGCNYKADWANLICNYIPRPAYIKIACFVYIFVNLGHWIARVIERYAETRIAWRRLKAVINANDHSPYAKGATHLERLQLSIPKGSIENINVQETKADDIESQIQV